MRITALNFFRPRIRDLDGHWRAAGAPWNSDQEQEALEWCRQANRQYPRAIFVDRSKVAEFRDGQFVHLDPRFSALPGGNRDEEEGDPVEAE